MYSIKDLEQHLKQTHNIDITPSQEILLRNLGYYHGYKGYRFIRVASTKINFSNFKEIAVLNKFDLLLKTLFYPRIMYIETALKSYVLEAVLSYAQSEDLSEIYKICLTDYKSLSKGSSNYEEAFKKRMRLQMKINSALIRDYEKKRNIETHFFNQDRPIPVWAVFESLSLGEFGSFVECCGQEVRKYVSKLLHLPTNLDPDGKMVSRIIFCLRDLRNSIAHNNPIFDARFKSVKIHKNFINLLKTETGIKSIDFNDIDSYFIVVCYILGRIGQKKDAESFIHEYENHCNYLYKNLPTEVYFKILKSSHNNDLQILESYIKQLETTKNQVKS